MMTLEKWDVVVLPDSAYDRRRETLSLESLKSPFPRTQGCAVELRPNHMIKQVWIASRTSRARWSKTQRGDCEDTQLDLHTRGLRVPVNKVTTQGVQLWSSEF